MYLKRTVSKGRSYYKIMHNYWVKGKCDQRLILNIGRISEEMADRIHEWLNGYPMKTDEYVTTPLKAIKVKKQLNHGVEYIAKSIWDESGITELIDNTAKTRSDIGIKPGALAMIMAVNRCADPKSKLGVVEEYYPRTSLHLLCGISPEDLYVNRLCRAMDHLDKNSTEIEQKLWRETKQKFKQGVDAILYDMTSSYFESSYVDEKKEEKCVLRQHGYSREHRRDKKQVNWGLVLTKDGFPITHEVYSGNIPDKNTPAAISKKLKKKFGAKECIFVGDRGMMTAKNVEAVEKEDYLYVFAEDMRNVKDIVLLEIEKIPEDVWNSRHPLDDDVKKKYGITEIDEDTFCIEVKIKVDEKEDGETAEEENKKEVRYIICHGREKAKDDRGFRESQIDKGKEIIGAVQKSVKAGRLKDHDKVLKRIVRNLTKKRLKDYFDWDIPQTPVSDFKYWVKDEKINELEKLDGKWVIRTNIKEGHTLDDAPMMIDDLVNLYKTLQIVERAFRTIKSFIKVRPINHHLDTRIRAHIFIAVLSYLIEKTIEHKLKLAGVSMTAQKVFSEFEGIMASDIQMGDKVPVMVRRVTELNTKQKKIFKDLDIMGIKKLNHEMCMS